MKILKLKRGEKSRLFGFSGNDIFVYRDWDDVYVVKKQAMNEQQSLRLQKQYQKHLFFQKIQTNYFKVPTVLNHGFGRELFFYEYKFVDGQSLVEYFIDNDIKSILPVLNKLIEIIKDFKKENIYFEKEYSEKDFIKALREKIITNFEKLSLGQNYNYKIKMLNYIKKIEFSKKISLNHGDLTFDNIIVDPKGELWLIDYSGNFYPHYWLDLATLFQDLDGSWHEIKHAIKIKSEKKLKLSSYLKNKISNLDPNYLEHHNFFMALIFLRILPYTQSENMRKEVLTRFEKFVNLI